MPRLTCPRSSLKFLQKEKYWGKRQMTHSRRDLLLGGTAAAALILWRHAADAQQPASWRDPAAEAAAKAEGNTLVVYSSINEQEALPVWKYFEETTGIKVQYVRGSDTSLISRVMIEHRAQQRSWDIMLSTGTGRLPPDTLSPFEPKEAAAFPASAKDPAGRWYGIHATYNSPAYNTKSVKPEELTKRYEDFLDRPQWSGRTAIDTTDSQWLMGMLLHLGEAQGRKLLSEIRAALKPVLTEGHLNLARQLAAGEYMVALNNYVSLTTNVKETGAPTDFWFVDPVVQFFEQLGISVRAPHPKTALYATSFLMSQDGQTRTTRWGRAPVRRDVTPIPPDLFSRLDRQKIVTVTPSTEEDRRNRRIFDEIFRVR